MGATTTSLGGGLSDTANQVTGFSSVTDLVSNVSIATTSTYVSGGFDSLGNAYVTRPIAITDVTVRVLGSSPTSTQIVRAQFSSSSSGSPSTPNSATSVNIATSIYPSTISLSTESGYRYKAFAGGIYYYGFEGVSYAATSVYYANGGGSGSIYKDGTSINSSTKLSGSITQASIPSSPGNPNVLSITDTTANIIWSAPTDDGMQDPAAYSGSNINGYRINYRNSSSENWKVLVANTGSNLLYKVVTGLSPSTYYEIQVAALNDVTDAHNSTYTNITAHVGARSITHPFTTTASTHDIRIWDGSAYKKGIVKVWDGSAWLEYPDISIKIWNGTAFEDATLET